MGQAREQLRESVELQLNEMERLCHIEEYLADNHVQVVPIVPAGCPEEAGFAVAMTGQVVGCEHVSGRDLMRLLELDGWIRGGRSDTRNLLLKKFARSSPVPAPQ